MTALIELDASSLSPCLSVPNGHGYGPLQDKLQLFGCVWLCLDGLLQLMPLQRHKRSAWELCVTLVTAAAQSIRFCLLWQYPTQFLAIITCGG